MFDERAFIADAAHAIGTEIDGRQVGGEGDAAVFSFYPTKNVTTGRALCASGSQSAFAAPPRRPSRHAPQSIAEQEDPWPPNLLFNKQRE